MDQFEPGRCHISFVQPDKTNLNFERLTLKLIPPKFDNTAEPKTYLEEAPKTLEENEFYFEGNNWSELKEVVHGSH